MTKRVLSVILAAVLLFSVLPMTVFAEVIPTDKEESAPVGTVDNDLASTSLTDIKSIAVTDVVTPYGGQKPSYSAKVPFGAGYVLDTDSVCWKDFRDEYVEKTDAFHAGINYTLYITIYAASAFCTFDNLTACTINGSSAGLHWYRGVNSQGIGFVCLECTYTCGGIPVNEIKVTGVVPPVAGQRPNYTAVIPSGQGYKKYVFTSERAENSVAWSDENDHSMLKTDTFVAGKTYIFNIALYPESDEYYFDFFNDFKSSVNGMSGGNVIAYHGINSENYGYINLECEFTCEAAPSGNTINGIQTSYLDSLDTANIRLYQGGMLKYRTTSTGNEGNFSFGGVKSGTYTLTISKKNHVTREYTVHVSENKTVDVTICPLGDVDGNGKVQASDAMKAYQHAQGKADMQLSGYAFDCADVAPVGSPNGKVQAADAMMIYQQAQGKHSLF